MIVTLEDLEQTLEAIQTYEGAPTEFGLQVPDEKNDAVIMAIVTDAVLGKGWFPDGFSQHDGYRIYHYMSMEDVPPEGEG